MDLGVNTESHLLGGSGVVISRVISPLIWVISIVTLLITLLITTHEPPSWCVRAFRKSCRDTHHEGDSRVHITTT